MLTKTKTPSNDLVALISEYRANLTLIETKITNKQEELMGILSRDKTRVPRGSKVFDLINELDQKMADDYTTGMKIHEGVQALKSV